MDLSNNSIQIFPMDSIGERELEEITSFMPSRGNGFYDVKEPALFEPAL